MVSGKVLIDDIDHGYSDYIFFDVSDKKNVLWSISENIQNVNEIYCANSLERLTSMEADSSLQDWFQALAVGGKLIVEVPDMDYYAQMWLNADWNEQTLRDPNSDAQCSFRALNGDQKNGNPRFDNYDDSYSYVNKSSYNERRLKFLLERAGFTDVLIEKPVEGILKAVATKSMDKGERQVAPDLKQIRADHKARYEFAAKHIERNEKVLDFACGIGYGAKIIADMSGPKEILACDISEDALIYAKKYYSSEVIEFKNNDAQNADLPSNYFDTVVSFETIEHIPKPEVFLKSIFDSLKAGGRFICSSPNEDFLEWSKDQFPFHCRHYTKLEFCELLTNAGFNVVTVHSQKDNLSSMVDDEEDGAFLIVIARKP